MSKLLYGYTTNENGSIIVNEQEADIVKIIFQSYIVGSSLGKIAAILSEKQILSPSGNDTWTRAALDKILSNGKYTPHIISVEQFFEVQMEKANRSNVNLDTGKRKAARYNSQNVLSGLLICGECGANYRRITPALGEVVWRCANRVERGETDCKQSPSVREIVVTLFICSVLNMSQFNPQIVRNSLSSIIVNHDGTMSVEYKQTFATVLSH